MTAEELTEAEEELVTIDELAGSTGLSVRTTRYYTSLGLLPPPIRRGRVGYYSPRHRARLELIQALQEHGFGLTAIERYVKTLPHDASVEDIAIKRILLAPWVTHTGERLDRRGLERRVGRRLSDRDIETLGALGALETVDGEFRTTPTLDLGVEMLGVPIPLEGMLEAREAIERATSALARELGEIQRRRVVDPYRDDPTGVDPDEVARALRRLRPLTIQAIVAGFQQAADRIVQQSLVDESRVSGRRRP